MFKLCSSSVSLKISKYNSKHNTFLNFSTGKNNNWNELQKAIKYYNNNNELTNAYKLLKKIVEPDEINNYSELQKAIKYYRNNEFVKSHNILAKIRKSDETNKCIRAGAHLYEAKMLFKLSSACQWSGIKNIEIAEQLINNLPDELKDKCVYKKELEEKKVILEIMYGPIDEYKKNLKEHLIKLKQFNGAELEAENYVYKEPI